MPVPALNLKRRLLLAASLGGSSIPADAGLRIGGFEVAPLVMAGPPGGSPLVGALPEYLRSRVELLLPFALHWQPLMTFARGLRSLEDGSLDLLMPLGTGRPTKAYQRFGWPLLQVQPHLALRSDAPLQAVPRLEVLAGLQIGWVAHSRLPEGLEHLPVRWQRLSTQHWQAVALRMLDAGRLDAVYFANVHSPLYWQRRLGLALRLLPLPLPPRMLTLAHATRSDPERIASFERLARPWFESERFASYLTGYQADQR